MDEAVQPAPAGKPGTGTVPAGRPEDGRRVHYERRRPEDTALYQLVQEHLETLVVGIVVGLIVLVLLIALGP